MTPASRAILIGVVALPATLAFSAVSALVVVIALGTATCGTAGRTMVTMWMVVGAEFLLSLLAVTALVWRAGGMVRWAVPASLGAALAVAGIAVMGVSMVVFNC